MLINFLSLIFGLGIVDGQGQDFPWWEQWFRI